MARKKAVPPQSSLQTGFGFEIMDAQGQQPQFVRDAETANVAMAAIEQALWASVDVETTGLTDASLPVPLTPQMLKEGASSFLRMRTIQVRVPTVNGRYGNRLNFAFDCDKMGPALTQKVAQSILSRSMFIAHNAGFDLYWLRRAEGRTTMPAMVVDTMLLTRLLRPELVLKRAALLEDIKHKNDMVDASAEEQAAWNSLVGGASGGSLADVVLAMFDVVVDKTYQKPQNWTGLLGFKHLDYALDDVIWADRILCELLEVTEEGDLLQAYLGQRARKATVRLIEPQVPDLVRLREQGMPLNQDVGRRYVVQQREVLAEKVNELVGQEPTLEPYRAALGDPEQGLDDHLKKALALAFESRGVVLRKTAATGAPQVGEKDLRACKAMMIDAARPLFNAWVAVNKAKKSSNMAQDVVGFSERSEDGRVHSLMSHGPVTGRLSASEPNCFTGDTEILTEQGWTRFDELQNDQRVMQYDQGNLSLTKTLDNIRESWSGDLVHNVSRNIDLLTTPKHRCLLVGATSTGTSTKSTVVEAQSYPEGKRQLHAAQYLGGKGLALTDLELRFLVMLHVGGIYCAHSSKFDVQFTKHQQVLRMRKLFAAEIRASADQARGATMFQFDRDSKHVKHVLKYLGNALALGSWIYALTRAQLDVFVAEIAFWSSYETRKPSLSDYRTKRETDAQWVQIAFALSGITARVVQPAASAAWTESSWKVVGTNKDYSYTDNRVQTRQPYAGLVHCVTVPSGFIMVRRNGRVMITGQCQQWPRDQLFRAMCMSATKPGCETMQLAVTALSQPLIAKVAGHAVEVGQSVTVDTPWMAGQFASDKKVPDWPKEERQALNDLIEDQFTHRVVASDFGALDVRVGAALCIRSQREMLALANGYAVPGPVQPPDAIVQVIQDVVRQMHPKEGQNPAARLTARAAKYLKMAQDYDAQLEALKADLDAERIQKKQFFPRRSALKHDALKSRLGYRLAQCLAAGLPRGEHEYSALRDAFVADIDIHTFTGMKLAGRDPMAEFGGLPPAERKLYEKKLKKELGPRRQQGKIANLSLLYGMADAGFQEAAARGYNEHWSLAEAGSIRALWMDAYPEVELWHLWTECLQAGVVYVPEQGREKPVRTGWWMARTLAGRDIVALGLNAALSYQDQSTGADILGLIMHRMQVEYPAIAETAINQVHDEVVYCYPAEHHETYLPTIENVMVGEANSLLMPYGVPGAVSPACGVLWIKD